MGNDTVSKCLVGSTLKWAGIPKAHWRKDMYVLEDRGILLEVALQALLGAVSTPGRFPSQTSVALATRVHIVPCIPAKPYRQNSC